MTSLKPDQPKCQVMGRFVKDLATLSKCEDGQVAAVITNNDASQVYSIGVNGGPKGGPQCLCHYPGKYSCVHAEANAIAKDHSTDKSKVMFMTLSPCVTCASLMVNDDIRAVFYLKKWKNTDGLDILQQCGVQVYHLNLEGDERLNE